MIVLNFKAYREVSGKKAVEAAKIAERFSKKLSIAVCPQFLDIPLVSRNSTVQIIAQHVDPLIEGKGTGQVSFHSLLSYGVKASLLNHSERKVSLQHISAVVKLSRKLNFRIFLLADSLAEAERLLQFKPWALGFEPPELIGTGRSVSKTKPKTLEKFVKLVKANAPKTLAFCGAGISSREDVEKALELGVDGVLISSAFAKARNKLKALKEFVEPFRER